MRNLSKYIKAAIMALPYGQSMKRATKHVSRRRIKKELAKRGQTLSSRNQIVSIDLAIAERRMLATMHKVSPNVIHAIDSSCSGVHHRASLFGGSVLEINELGAKVIDGRGRIYHVTQ